MGFLDRLTQLGKAVLSESLRTFGSSLIRDTSGRSHDSSSSSHSSAVKKSRQSQPTPGSVHRANGYENGKGVLSARLPSDFPGPDDTPKLYDVAALGLPSFHYRPDNDMQPDPGEVVWTWVPYEEDRSQGKDRPVLVVAEAGSCVVVAQLTSKDHDRDAAQEAFHGRYWLDIGVGPWDSQGRPSEVRLDRLLIVHPTRVRRQGGSLDKTRFTQVIHAIESFHR